MSVRKTLSPTLYGANFTITVLGFFLWGLYFPILWDLLISSTVIAITLSFMFSQIVLTATSSVTSPVHSGIPCKSIQLHLEYCSCLSICFSKIAKLSFSFKLLSSKIFIFYFLPFVFLVFIKLSANKVTRFLQLVHVHLTFIWAFIYCFDHCYHSVHFEFNNSWTLN